MRRWFLRKNNTDIVAYGLSNSATLHIPLIDTSRIGFALGASEPPYVSINDGYGRTRPADVILHDDGSVQIISKDSMVTCKIIPDGCVKVEDENG